MSSPRFELVGCHLVLLLALVGCSQAALGDRVLSSAYRPPPVSEVPIDALQPPYRILAGDLHCHVSPPDDPGHVRRDFSATVALARRENLDFVVLTPHLWALFFQSEGLRETAIAWQRALEDDIAQSAAQDIVFIPGFEYSDPNFGHVGLSFADMDAVLRDLPMDVALSHPAEFVARWVDHGGIVVLHHPLQTPVRSPFTDAASFDMSFRPLTSPGPYPEEIVAFRDAAQGFEAFNLMSSRLRDWLLLHDSGHSARAVMSVLDREIVRQRRRIAPTGGSDSHGRKLRATMFVLARERTASGVREAILAGRTCVRDPDACTLVARAAPGATEVMVGGSIRGVTSVEASAGRDGAELILDGKRVARLESGRFVRIPVPPTCTLLRAIAGKGFSAPIAVNCDFE